MSARNGSLYVTIMASRRVMSFKAADTMLETINEMAVAVMDQYAFSASGGEI
jgi:hypothetical protein